MRVRCFFLFFFLSFLSFSCLCSYCFYYSAMEAVVLAFDLTRKWRIWCYSFICAVRFLAALQSMNFLMFRDVIFSDSWACWGLSIVPIMVATSFNRPCWRVLGGKHLERDAYSSNNYRTTKCRLWSHAFPYYVICCGQCRTQRWSAPRSLYAESLFAIPALLRVLKCHVHAQKGKSSVSHPLRWREFCRSQIHQCWRCL